MKFNLQKLLLDANAAIAWGHPDSESTGMTHTELINIIRQLRNVVIVLSKDIPLDKVEPVYELGISKSEDRFRFF